LELPHINWWWGGGITNQSIALSTLNIESLASKNQLFFLDFHIGINFKMFLSEEGKVSCLTSFCLKVVQEACLIHGFIT
jgi:hypothetical protein